MLSPAKAPSSAETGASSRLRLDGRGIALTFTGSKLGLVDLAAAFATTLGLGLDDVAGLGLAVGVGVSDPSGDCGLNFLFSLEVGLTGDNLDGAGAAHDGGCNNDRRCCPPASPAAGLFLKTSSGTAPGVRGGKGSDNSDKDEA
mmetsp:Transcript_20656/g.37212  ORF Transcript_20656/g.37212 Transcript_20656/m.37212 type:complete len:144 (+) Transcript_20656:465-896(+)